VVRVNLADHGTQEKKKTAPTELNWRLPPNMKSGANWKKPPEPMVRKNRFHPYRVSGKKPAQGRSQKNQQDQKGTADAAIEGIKDRNLHKKKRGRTSTRGWIKEEKKDLRPAKENFHHVAAGGTQKEEPCGR